MARRQRISRCLSFCPLLYRLLILFPYDGKSAGEFGEDTVGPHQHSFFAGYSWMSPNGELAPGTMYGNNARTTVFITSGRTSHETAPAWLAILYYIVY